MFNMNTQVVKKEDNGLEFHVDIICPLGHNHYSVRVVVMCGLHGMFQVREYITQTDSMDETFEFISNIRTDTLCEYEKEERKIKMLTEIARDALMGGTAK